MSSIFFNACYCGGRILLIKGVYSPGAQLKKIAEATKSQKTSRLSYWVNTQCHVNAHTNNDKDPPAELGISATRAAKRIQS